MELELWGMSFNYCLEKWFIPGNYIIHFSFTYCKKRNANFGKTEPRKSLFFFFLYKDAASIPRKRFLWQK